MTRPLAWLPLLVALGLFAFPASGADEFQPGSLRVHHVFARATPPGARTAAVYFTVDNPGSVADRLVHASTPLAAGVVLHQSVLEDGVMRMRVVPSVEVIPGARVEFGPNDGYRLMLLDLRQPLRPGERFPMTLTFEHDGAILISVVVEGMGASQGATP